MVDSAEKGRAERLLRLNTTLSTKLENPAAALETLMSELKVGDPHPDLWEALHAAAARDGVEVETVWAYQKITADRRLQGFAKPVAAQILINAANFTGGVLGDAAGAEEFLQRALTLMPGLAEPFHRLAKRFEEAGDHLRLTALFAAAAENPPKPAAELAHEVVRSVALVPARTPMSDDVCRRLMVLVPANLSLLEALVTHCTKSARPALAGELYERVIEMGVHSPSAMLQLRKRVAELWLGAAADPARAMPHVELLLEHDATDAWARDAARRLLSTQAVASRAAAALQRTRQHDRPSSRGR